MGYFQWSVNDWWFRLTIRPEGVSTIEKTCKQTRDSTVTEYNSLTKLKEALNAMDKHQVPDIVFEIVDFEIGKEKEDAQNFRTYIQRGRNAVLRHRVPL